MVNLNINKKESYGLKSKVTGKIVETFRLKETAYHMKDRIQKKIMEELEVVEL